MHGIVLISAQQIECGFRDKAAIYLVFDIQGKQRIASGDYCRFIHVDVPFRVMMQKKSVQVGVILCSLKSRYR
jgi:hypothetical protein